MRAARQAERPEDSVRSIIFCGFSRQFSLQARTDLHSPTNSSTGQGSSLVTPIRESGLDYRGHLKHLRRRRPPEERTFYKMEEGLKNYGRQGLPLGHTPSTPRPSICFHPLSGSVLLQYKAGTASINQDELSIIGHSFLESRPLASLSIRCFLYLVVCPSIFLVGPPCPSASEPWNASF